MAGAVSTCERCGKTMDSNQFYTYRDGTKTELCKKCLTAHIDNFNPDTYLWILEKMDVPYIPEEWANLRARAFDKKPILDGMSVIGKYLSKMKLSQYNKYHWADTEKLQAQKRLQHEADLAEKAQYETELKEQLDNGEISEAQYKTLVSVETQNQQVLSNPSLYLPQQDNNNPFLHPEQFISEEELDLAQDLTEDDKRYLALKWGRLYTPNEWILMEKDYDNMMKSFDIQDADTINTLILICKTNLKMNQALDSGDIEGYQKLSKVSTDLRKSAKFTAAQNKEEKEDFVDSVGELITMCEREGFIPRYALDIPQDKVDQTLEDMKNYVKKLVTQDLGFGQQIEDAIKKIQIQQEMSEQFDQEVELEDNDFEEYYNEIEAQKEQDEMGDE